MTEVILAKGFSSDPEQGNPAGVVTEASGLTGEEMQLIASEIGFSVTAFVDQKKEKRFNVRFFTPEEEDRMCGHGTIATFHVLREEGFLNGSEYFKAVQETKAGDIEVECMEDGRIVMKQKRPEKIEFNAERKRISRLLGIKEEALLDHPIEIISTGKPKMMIPLNSFETLSRIEPDYNGIENLCKESGAKGFYPFTFEAQNGGDIHARQFNPVQGIYEDPITGTAAGPLGAYLKKHGLIEKKNIVVEQGYLMDKAGKVYVNVKEEAPKVGGYGSIYGKREI